MNSLMDSLFGRYQKGRIGQFYILKSTGLDPAPQETLNSWCQQWLIKILSFELKLDDVKALHLLQLGHPDILWLAPPEKEYYSIEKDELGPLFKAMAYAPMELPRRWIILPDAHALSERLGNKLLKTLEEPQGQTSFLFLNAKRSALLPTIESRAIELCISDLTPLKTNKALNRPFGLDFEAFCLQDQRFSELISEHQLGSPKEWAFNMKLSKDKTLLDKATQAYIEWQTTQITDFKQKEQLLHEIQWYYNAKLYHNRAAERIFGLSLP